MKYEELLLDSMDDSTVIDLLGATAGELKKLKGNTRAFLLKTEEDGAFMVRRLRTDEFDRFMGAAKAEGTRYSVEARNAACACVLYPDKAVFAAILEEQPGLGMTITGKLLEMAGLSQNVEVKKL